MKEFYEVKYVPKCTYENAADMSLVYNVIERLEDESCTELRFRRINKTTRCFVAFDADKYNHLSALLNGMGYVITQIDDSIKAELASDTTSMFLCRSSTADIQGTDIMHIEYGGNFKDLCCILNNMKDGAGFSLFVWKKTKKEIVELNHIISNEKFQTSNIMGLLENRELYTAVWCVSGNEEEQKVIASELKVIFHGLCCKAIEDKNGFYSIPLDADNIKYTISQNRYSSNNSILNQLICTYTVKEIDMFGRFNCMADVPGGLRSNINHLLGNDFYVSYDEESSISLGKNLTSDTDQRIPLKKLRQGMVILGSPGSGKGNHLFMIAEQLYEKNIPFLIFESAKQELHLLRKTVSELNTWRPQSDGFVLNPFALPEDVTLGEYRPSLMQMLSVCFKLDGSLEEWFGKTINNCFSAIGGYNDNSKSGDQGLKSWGLHDFIIEYKKLLENGNYSQNTKSDITQAGLVRLTSLLNQNPTVFDTINSVPVTQLLTGYNLIQLNCLPTIQSKQLFATMLLISLGAYMQLRFQYSREPLKLVIIMDESHNLLNSADAANGNYSFSADFANMMLTLRSAGVGFIVADQSADNIPKIITDVCDTKIFVGSSKFSGINEYLGYLGSEERAAAAIGQLHRLNPGEGIYVSSEMPHGVFIKTPDIIDKYLDSENIDVKNDYISAHKDLMCATFSECIRCPNRFGEFCNITDKSEARQIAEKHCLVYGARFANAVKTYNKDSIEGKPLLSKEIKTFVMSYSDKEIHILYCAFIQLVRLINREYAVKCSSHCISLSQNTITQIYNNEKEGI